MTDPIVTYSCPIADVEHAIPSDSVRVMKIGDGGFVIGCDCSEEPLSEVDEQPHPTTDHIVNIYARDPSPEEWIRLEDAADGWYDTTRWHSPEEFDGTHGQRRVNFREGIEDLVDEEDGRDLDPTPREVRAREVICPNCKANAGRKCKRPSGHRVRKLHQERIEKAVSKGIVDSEGEGQTPTEEQAQIDIWA